ncbi:rhodanese-like domain-containing protein [Sulfuriferula nivalis]|uniref:Rhodanese-like domain-containing protein n=1 Tax=Sulfuriferula nivalis TaxID=2675298 RepID=A0A809RZ02_9PROT|nr:rhodanese-like domain-containing protein [Sulfuriferula nivalis]BBO99427.1 rhodanese-like domain-containing protein [Sulfuriferula nivalis]
MPTLSAILQTARERAAAANLPYSGLLTPGEAHYLSQHAPSAHIVDVRSHAELDLVGVVESAVNIEWQTFPGWRANPDFISQLKASVDPESLVMFMCRSGGRSNSAAIAAQAVGYSEVYNILEGFEGDKNEEGRRGYKSGWKVAGLPWKHK